MATETYPTPDTHDMGDDEPSGWLAFAAIVMFSVGFYRIIEAIAYFANSHKLNDVTNGLFSDHFWAWGAWDLLIALTAILAGMSILAGGRFGRWIGYIWAILVIVQGFAVVNLTPWFAFLMIGLAGFVIYGLAANPRQATR
jgi:hypothetical protein